MSVGPKLGILLGIAVFVIGFQCCLGALVGVIILSKKDKSGCSRSDGQTRFDSVLRIFC